MRAFSRMPLLDLSGHHHPLFSDSDFILHVRFSWVALSLSLSLSLFFFFFFFFFYDDDDDDDEYSSTMVLEESTSTIIHSYLRLYLARRVHHSTILRRHLLTNRHQIDSLPDRPQR